MNNYPMGLPSNYTNNPMFQYYMQQMAAIAQQQAQAKAAQQTAVFEQPQPVTQVQTPQQVEEPIQVQQPLPISGDGKDDGKISFGSKLKNFAKGVGNFFKGMVCDENGKFSIKRTLTTVAVAAGATALTIATGGAAAPYLIAAGAAMGTFEVGKGAYKAATAKTDAEAEAAWQTIGSGATAVAGSVAGAKSALKTAKVDVSSYKGLTGAIKATGQSFKYAYNNTKAGLGYIKANGITNSVNTAKNTMATNFKTNWESAFKSTNAKENAKSQMNAKYEAKIAQNNAKSEALMKEIANLQKDPTKNATKITQKQNELASILHENTRLEARRTSLPETVTTKNNKAKMQQINKEIAELKAEIKDIKQTLPEADVSVIENEIAAKIAMKNKLAAQQTNAGVRQAQLENLTAKQEILQNQIKATNDKGLKSAYQQQLNHLEMRIAEVKKFAKIEQAQESVAAAKTRLPKYEAKLNEINQRIEYVKNNNTITAQEKATALVELGKEQANATKLVNAAKAKLNAGKRQLHWENIKGFEQANRKSIGYPTIALTGGNVVTLDELNEADALARQYGFNSAAEMQDYINKMEAQEAQHTQQASTEQANQNQYTNQPQQNTQITNPYEAYQQMYNQLAQMQPPVGNNLGFNELYASPYANMMF